MRHIISAGVALVAFQLVGIAPSLAQTCYAQETIPAKTTCQSVKGKGGQHSFDDFSTGGCTYTPAKTVTKETKCPGKWVNATFTTSTIQVGGGGRDNEPRTMTVNVASSHAAPCSAAGLTASNFEGRICAAGEARPSSGAGWESVNYKFGKWGSGQPAGTQTSTANQQTYCWNAGQKRDHDRTDLLVAWYCG